MENLDCPACGEPVIKTEHRGRRGNMMAIYLDMNPTEGWVLEGNGEMCRRVLSHRDHRRDCPGGRSVEAVPPEALVIKRDEGSEEGNTEESSRPVGDGERE